MITRAIPQRAVLLSEKMFLCHSLLVTLAQEQPSPPAWCKHGMLASFSTMQLFTLWTQTVVHVQRRRPRRPFTCNGRARDRRTSSSAMLDAMDGVLPNLPSDCGQRVLDRLTGRSRL